MRGATSLLVRSELRQRWAAYLGVALIIALGCGASLGAFVVAHRTDRAYPAYVERAQVAKLVVNPSIATLAADQVIRGLPGVLAVHSDATLLASVQYTEPTPASVILAADDTALIVRGSIDGRYIDVDRPVITSGRFATDEREVFVNDEFHPDLEAMLGHTLRVGDEIDVAFWWGGAADADYAPDEVVSPVGVERLRISGFGRLPDEVLPDELYPRERLIVSPDVAARYDCVGDLRADMSADEAFSAVIPPGCARDYRYYSLQLDDDTTLAAIREAFNDSLDRLSADIPPELAEEELGYYFVTLDRTVLDHAVREATRPTVFSLLVFGLMSALAAIAVAALTIARTLQRGRQSDLALRAIGVNPRRRVWILSIPPLLAGAAGLVAAILVAVIVSPVGPVGSARSVAPSPGFSLPLAVMVPVVAVLAFVFSLVVVALTSWAARNRREQSQAARVSRSATVLGRVGHPAASEGMRAALGVQRGTGKVAVLAGLVIAMAGIIATVVFGASLIAVVNDPPRYGWPWDVAVITGGGYGDTVGETVVASLEGDPSVKDYGFFSFDALSRIDDDAVTTIYGFAGSQSADFPIVRGRSVARAGEAVVGSRTADELGIAVGDRVTVESTLFEVGDVTVVGVAVLPALGPFLADRTGLGSGAFVLLDVDPLQESNPAALTAIRLRDDTDASAFLGRLEPFLTDWDAFNIRPFARSTSVKPPEIVNVDGLLSAPLVLGALLGLALLVGLPLAIGVSVRDRQRELAILRSLGFSSRDLRTTVRWQAATIVTVGALVAIPLGIITGRLAWNRFADRLGLVPSADIPYLWLTLVIVAIVLITMLGALPPARTATRISPTEVLRENAQ